MGTYYFIALQLMKSDIQEPVHLARHDLESFYWVLVWIVLRHTNHNHPSGMRACDKVFPYGDDEDATIHKEAWINRWPVINIHGNEPLSELLQKFGILIHQATRSPLFGPPQIPLVYDAVLKVLDEALARDDWPVDDKAIPFVHEKTRTTTVFGGNVISKAAESSGTGGKRTHGEHVRGSEIGSDLMSASMPMPPSASTMESTKPQKRRKGSSASVLGGVLAGPSSSAIASGSNPPVTDDPPTRESSPTPAPHRRSTRLRGRGSKTTSGTGKALGGRRSRGSGTKRAP
ncbi:hypothetical protein C8Q79DRAFT_930010 [Trametes meyenii]|nr:hypothetical protein C8Q79DRAFT_930010 [Trametes meyenii]